MERKMGIESKCQFQSCSSTLETMLGKPFNLFKDQQSYLEDEESIKWGSMPENVQHVTRAKNGTSAIVSRPDWLDFPQKP